MPESDEKWMQIAVHMAREAAKLGEVPIGAVMVGTDGKILSSGSNRTITDTDPTAHAEILVVRGGTHYTAVEYPELVSLRIERFYRDHGF